MKVGKLDWDDLKYLINNNKTVLREDVRIRSGIGEDCSVVNFGDKECVLSTDPITGADKNSGKLAVNINCNDIASCGIEPVGILVTILAPEHSTLEEINSVMQEIDYETKKLNVEILGGHTEVTRAVNKMVISCTVIGKGEDKSAVATSGAREGDDIIITKNLCLEGTSIIVNDYEKEVANILSEAEIKEAKSYIENISVVKEGLISGKFGVNSMHDITEGGILGAIWEVAKASKKGFKIYKDKMPITEITSKLCSKYDIDPLRLISSGSMLITAENGKSLVEVLEKHNIKACIVGKITDEKGILIDKNCENEVDPPKRDELFVFKEKLS
ncbi:AIR synthase [Clostridium tyrobutyricum]|jgi:hydrogenase expression/formation protein HypE|uniref:Thiamine-monophosphate kinase n=1 Tax=Clostridium tyrobutyricum DIVETGP TaxID=1408889 RepID=W6N655_CLOTY|nr:AIR synthase family protein [Clostridium tyrobutyricum]AND85848.1 hydrogenase formation factor HypE [Clostridium tyrobutyricum]ANP70360.1 AIR synthase [Clostridium tyrobutyricum]MBV4414602.1 AIR synthase family protein [Clostridium tyrobutyricum]MBV4423508.1 AIR synthase family protein [Clostridium tyrobutyricum]MBV4428581.1 AIR synthase family protein [Clostridium tyrobutyricum]